MSSSPSLTWTLKSEFFTLNPEPVESIASHPLAEDIEFFAEVAPHETATHGDVNALHLRSPIERLNESHSEATIHSIEFPPLEYETNQPSQTISQSPGRAILTFEPSFAVCPQLGQFLGDRT